MYNPELQASSPVKRWVLIVWPAFVATCLLEALVFSVVDPSEVHWPNNVVQPTRQSVYTLAFFSFWLVSMACSGLAYWLASPQIVAEKVGKM